MPKKRTKMQRIDLTDFLGQSSKLSTNLPTNLPTKPSGEKARVKQNQWRREPRNEDRFNTRERPRIPQSAADKDDNWRRRD